MPNLILSRKYPLYFIIILLLLTVWLQAGCSPAQPAGPPAPASVPHLLLHHPPAISAGERVIVVVTAPNLPDGELLTLAASGISGVYPMSAAAAGGQAVFSLPPAITRHSGALSLTAAAGLGQAQSTLLINPGPPTGLLPARITASSITVGGAEWTMVVAIPRDEWGNPVDDGVPVAVQVQHPTTPTQPAAAGRQIIRTKTDHILAWARINSRNIAGQTRLAVSAGQAYSPELTFRQIPAQPRPFSLQVSPQSLPADGHQLAQITTGPLADVHGNSIMDGTGLTFLVIEPDGRRRNIPAIVIDSMAKIDLQAPTRSGLLTVQAMLNNTLSQPLTMTITAGPSVATIPLTLARWPEAIILTAGPLVGPLGQLIPDGTPVQFEIAGPRSAVISLTSRADYGYAQATLRRAVLVTGTYTVQVTAGTGQGRLTFEGP